MKIKEIISILEEIAPPSLQESYDNSGLIVGNKDWECKAALISLDATEEIVAEAKHTGCNLVIAHHPIVFSGLKRFNGSDYVQRTIMFAIKHDIAIYAIHTNLDNVLANGVNEMIGRKLGLQHTKILRPMKNQLAKLVNYVPTDHAQNVLEALWDAGAGHIGKYDCCSYQLEGKGTYRAGEGAQPFKGEIGSIHKENETRLELIFPIFLEKPILRTLKAVHPYEEVAYEILRLENEWQEAGSGLLGTLEKPMAKADFLNKIKVDLNSEVVRYTSSNKEEVQLIAVCGGSGSFLLPDAKAAGADVLLTADFKYHQFFDAENEIMICDPGHFETEQFTIELLAELLLKKRPNFAVNFATAQTNPVQYFY